MLMRSIAMPPLIRAIGLPGTAAASTENGNHFGHPFVNQPLPGFFTPTGIEAC